MITGAAGGIGSALARRCAAEGMALVLTDRAAERLEELSHALEESGASVLAVPADVSRAHEVERLGRAARQAFGAVHLLCNNAAVAAIGRTWEFDAEDWERVLATNVGGVVHGVRVFVPMLLAQGEGHVVNVASEAGLVSEPGLAPYRVSKHAVVALSETLRHDLAAVRSPVGVSVVCPAFVHTSMLAGARVAAHAGEDRAALTAPFERALASGMAPEEVAERTLEAVRARRFYVFTHPETRARVRERFDALLEPQDPELAEDGRDGGSARRDAGPVRSVRGGSV